MSTDREFSIPANDLRVGQHTITLTVWDDDGQTNTDTDVDALIVSNVTPTIGVLNVAPESVVEGSGTPVVLTAAAHDRDEHQQSIIGWGIEILGPDQSSTVFPGAGDLEHTINTAALAPGTYYAQVRAQDDEGSWSEPVTVSFAVWQQHIGPEIDVSDDSGDATDWTVVLPDTPVGETSTARVFTLANSGDQSLEISGLTKDGSHPNDLQITVRDDTGVEVSGSSFAIPAGASYRMEVRFAPTDEGVRSAEVTFSTNDPDDGEDEVTLAMSGMGQPVVADGSIHGRKWNDCDGDGTRSPDEPWLEGWTIYLDENQNRQLDAADPGFSHQVDPFWPDGTIVDPAGIATFSEALSGAAVVGAVPEWGNFPISDRMFGWVNGQEQDAATWSEETSILRVSFAQSVSTVSLDFFSQQPLEPEAGWLRAFDSSGGLLAEEEPQGNQQATSETVAVSLPINQIAYVEASGRFPWSPVMLDRLQFSRTATEGESSDTTNANGEYAFTELVAGTYAVAEVLPQWWEQTYPGGDGTYTITLEAGEVVLGRDFGNEEPPMVEVGDDTGIDEGSRFSRSGSFVDPRGSSWEATVDYGNGSGEQPLAVDQIGKTFALDHVYTDNGEYTVTVTVTDADLGAIGKDRLVVTVNNVAPSLWVRGMRIVDEGTELTVTDIGMFTDPGILDDPFQGHIVWGDGSSDDVSAEVDIPGAAGRPVRGTFDGTHTYLDSDRYYAKLSVTDKDGGTSRECGVTVVVNNVAPTVEAGDDLAANEGAAVTFSGAFDDPGTLDTHTIVWDFGDGSDPVAGTLTPPHVYADDGEYTVTLTVTDDGGAIGLDTLTVTVGNVAPELILLIDGRSFVDNEGKPFCLSDIFVFHDPGFDNPSGTPPTVESFTYNIDWGDGTSADTGPVANVQQGQPGVLTEGWFDNCHVYADNGTYMVTVMVRDDDMPVDTWAENALLVTVENVAPTVDAGADQGVEEGQVVTLGSATFNDKGTLDTHTATIDWGDGTVDSGTVTESPFGPPGDPAGMDGAVSGSHVYADDGAYTVTVTVTDDEGESHFDTLIMTVGNADPTLSVPGSQVVDEGENLDIVATFTDPGFSNLPALQPASSETFTYRVEWGDGSVDEGPVTDVQLGGPGEATRGSITGSHVYADNGTYSVIVKVRDDDMAEGTWVQGSFSVTVGSVAPTLTLASEVLTIPPLDEGSELTLETIATFSDPGFTNGLAGTEETFTYRVDWGDGKADEGAVSDVQQGGPGVPTEGRFGGSHVYADDGTYTVTVTVEDDDGDSDTKTFDVVVNNVVPTLWLAGNWEVEEGELLSIPDLGMFSDPGFDNPHATPPTAETFVYRIDWGDGTPEDSGMAAIDSPGEEGVPTWGSFDGSHIYADDGVYVATVTLFDDDLGSVVEYFEVTVTNVAPSITDIGEPPVIIMVVPEPFCLTFDFVDPGFDNPNTSPPTSESFDYLVHWPDETDGRPVTDVTSGSPGIPTQGSFTSCYEPGGILEPGIYFVQVTAEVSDDDGGWDAWTITVTLEVQGTPPAAMMASSSSSVVADADSESGLFAESAESMFALASFETNPSAEAPPPKALAEGTPPILTVIGNQTADEGATVPVDPADFGMFLDNDSAGPFPYRINWGDGTPEDTGSADIDVPGPPTAGSFDASHEYADNRKDEHDNPIPYMVTVVLGDEDEHEVTEVFEVMVNNLPPSANANGPYTAEENGSVLLDGSGTDAPGDQPFLVYEWDLDGDAIFGETGTEAERGDENVQDPVFSVENLDGPGSWVVYLRCRDDDGGESETVDATVNIANVPPTVVADNATGTVAEGQTATNTGTYFDPGDDTIDELTASVGNIIDNGDGTWSWSFDSTDGPDQTQTVTVTATDSDDDDGVTTFELVVNCFGSA